MLTSKQAEFLREQLSTAKNPLFFFDDDPDGLCSFLILYSLQREGHGLLVKSKPVLEKSFLRKVEEYRPDKIFVLDMPDVEQEFIDRIKVPLFWLDHHPPLDRQKIQYFNPRFTQPDIYIPTSRMAYQINPDPALLWIAMVGCIADYHLPDFQPEFIEKYSALMAPFKEIAKIDKIVYQTLLGKLTRIFSFILKGKTSEVNRCIRILTRIKSPEEILNQTTSQGKYLYKKYEEIDQKYQLVLSKAKKIKTPDKLFLFVYTEQSWSFTSELSGELIHLHPDKIVLVAREKSGEMKCSLRSKKTPLAPALERALVGIEGYGGGHELACGANIKKHDWDQFLINLKREIETG